MASIIVTAIVAMLCGEPKVNLQTLSCDALRIVAQEYLDQRDAAVRQTEADRAELKAAKASIVELEARLEKANAALVESKKKVASLTADLREARKALDFEQLSDSEKAAAKAASEGHFVAGMTYRECVKLMSSLASKGWSGPRMESQGDDYIAVAWTLTKTITVPGEMRYGNTYEPDQVKSVVVRTRRAVFDRDEVLQSWGDN